MVALPVSFKLEETSFPFSRKLNTGLIYSIKFIIFANSYTCLKYEKHILAIIFVDIIRSL